MHSIVDFFANRPWILVIIGFVILISVWTTFFIIAANNQPVRLIDF